MSVPSFLQPDLSPHTLPINIATSQRPGWARSITHPRNMGGYVATGETVHVEWTGTYDQLNDQWNSLISDVANYLAQLRLTMTSGDGNIFTLTCDCTIYESAQDDPSGDGAAESAGRSRNNPLYSFSASESTAPLLTLPQFDGASTKQLSLYQAIINGTLDDSEITVPTDAAGGDTWMQTTIGEQIANGELDDTLVALCRKMSDYVTIGATATATYVLGPNVAPPSGLTVATIATPPGPLAAMTPSNRNWLFVGGGYSTAANGEATYSETYKLSDVGGWDPTIYASS